MGWWLANAVAFAQDTGSAAHVVAPVDRRPVLDLRVGPATGSGSRPTVCVEGYPFERLSIEACGNGSGVFGPMDGPDFAHFRLRGVVARGSVGKLDVSAVAGGGLAEVQRTADQPGFLLGEARDSEQVEAAGAEVSASAKARAWVAERVYLVGDLDVGAAFVPAAPTVLGAGGPVVPFVSFTAGLGF